MGVFTIKYPFPREHTVVHLTWLNAEDKSKAKCVFCAHTFNQINLNYKTGL